MGVASLIFVMLLGSLASGYRATLVSQQRTAATSAANEIVERVRAQPYPEVAMNITDPALTDGSDPDISANGPCPPALNFGGESIVSRSITDPSLPLYRHVATFVRGSTHGTVRSYVTMLDSNGDCVLDAKRLTVVATWNSSPGGVDNTVRVATLFSPFGATALMASSATVYPVEIAATTAIGPGGPAPISSTIELPRQFGQMSLANGVNSTRGSSATASVAGTPSTPSLLAAAETDDTAATPAIGPGPVSAHRSSSLAGSFLAGIAPVSSADVTATSATLNRPDHQGSAGLGATSLVSATLPLGLSAVTLAIATADFDSSVRARRLTDETDQATASLSSPAVSLMRLPTWLPNGLVNVHAFTGTADAQAGGTTGSSVTAGTMTIDIYDPNNAVPPAVGLSGTCAISPSTTTLQTGVKCSHTVANDTTTLDIDVGASGFDLFQLSLPVSITVPAVACLNFDLAITQEAASAPAPKYAGAVVEGSEAHVSLPKIHAGLSVKTLPLLSTCAAGTGVLNATLSADLDLGKVDASATKT